MKLSRVEVKKHAAAIDDILAKYRLAHGVEAQPVIDDELFVRRAYLEVAGRIPSFAERYKFLIKTDSDRRMDLVDDLMNSEAYTQGWFHFYANLFRVNAFANNRVETMTYYSQWVKQAVRDNYAFDKMSYDLVTAVGMPYQNGAVGFAFHDAGMKPDHMANIIQTFMGMQMQCAQCHDHPFDRWNQYQFWEMTAFLGDLNTRGVNRYELKNRLEKAGYTEEQMQDAGVFKMVDSQRLVQAYRYTAWETHFKGKTVLPDSYAYADAKPKDQVLPKVMYGSTPKVKEGESKRQAFGNWLISEENPWFAKNISNRLWKRVMGVGLVEPVDNLKYDSEASIPALLDYISQLMIDVDYNSKDFLRVMFATEMFQRTVITEDLPEDYRNYHYVGRPMERMRSEQIWDSIVAMAIADPDERTGFGEIFLDPDIRKMKEKIWKMSGDELMNTLQNEYAATLKKATARPKGVKIPRTVIPHQTFANWGYSGVADERWSHVDRGVVRAAELESPAKAGHFVRQFGQSDRKGLYQGREYGAITQAMALLNGPTHELMYGKGSDVWNKINRVRSPEARTKVLFNAIVGRDPTPEDMALVLSTQARYPAKWERMTMWALMNSPEFMFKQ
jgi:hypothetical protein